MKCGAVQAYRGKLALRRRCELLGISRSACYGWCRRPQSPSGPSEHEARTEDGTDSP